MVVYAQIREVIKSSKITPKDLYKSIRRLEGIKDVFSNAARS